MTKRDDVPADEPVEWRQILDLDEVAEVIGHTPNYTGDLVRNADTNGFPPPRKRSGNVRLWDLFDVRKWAESRPRKRPANRHLSAVDSPIE